MVGEDSIQIGSVLGGFKIEKELGRGGMGIVYKGHELSLNRKVALKVLSERLCSDKEFIERFKREARVIAALNHPNIVSILSYGEEQGRYYFAMEYVSGKDLGQILKEKRVIPLDEALSIASQVAGALSEAGSRGVVHRDLKPSNIMIDDMGRAKVTDFGVAHFQDSGVKLTQTGLFLGTPEYASPEQATGRPLDVRSDIYALGAVLYRMLSGKPPMTGESPLAVMTKIATEPVTPIGRVNTALPEPVCDLIDKMMARDVDKRFQSPEEVVNAVNRCIDALELDIPVTKGRPSMPPPPAPQRKSRAKFWGGIAGIALAVLLIVWLVEGGFWQEKEKTPESVKEAVSEGSPSEPAETRGEASSVAPTPSAGKQGVAEGPGTATMQPEKIAKKKAQVPLPKIPTALMVISGDQALVPLVRTRLESLLMESGLRVASISEVPLLERKVQFGEIPITWHAIRQYVPPKRAQLLVLAEVQRVGSMLLRYYGRVQEMITASITVRAVDMATGTSAARPASGTVKYTQLNVQKNVDKTVAQAAGGMGKQIMGYWQKKLVAQKHPG
ncbi:MAG: serine/threonine protein kinase [Deltaproteobacteria bacterium]|nr:serine/threonine protein kinase [Deltaproteobacteria bacterium]